MHKLAIIDFETFYSDDYTLKKMTTEAYVRDPRFKIHCVGIKTMDNIPGVGENPVIQTDVMDGPTFSKVAHLVKDYAVVCHNAKFDGLILSHHYGVQPAFFFDTLSMARLIFPHDKSHSLEALAAKFGFPSKTVPYNEFRGIRDLPPETYAKLSAGCAHDVELTYLIFRSLLPLVPRSELRVIDMTIRMFTQPVLRLDYPRMEAYYEKVKADKIAILDQLGVTKDDLQSAAKFAELLKTLGVEPPTKPSPKDPNKQIYAFAKTDEEMKELCDDEDDRVSALCNARLGQKSTLNETRCERLLRMCERGSLTVPLRYYGAGASSRFSGEDKVNFQNFPRSGEIRECLMAPPGYVLLVGDLSQIECRMLNWLAGEEWVLQAFREGRDLYSELATTFYQRQITKADKAERGMGKQVELSCLGADTMVLTKSGYKPIVQITENDWLWDGAEWIKSFGCVERGKKTVINLAGLNITPDHLVLCGNMWKEAQDLHAEENAMFQALATSSENLPLWDTKLERVGGFYLFVLNALAGLVNTMQMFGRSWAAVQHAAMLAVEKKAMQLEKCIGVIRTFVQMMLTGDVCCVGLPSAWVVAIAPHTNGFPATAEGAFMFGSLGEKTSGRFWLTSFHFPDGIFQPLSLIALTMKKAMSRVILGLLLTQKTTETKEPSTNNKKKLMTYDLAFAGPRNRYTVATNAGPIIVHNCGFGSGGPKIALTARRGTYGPPVYITDQEGTAWRDHYRRTHPKICGKGGLWEKGEHVLAALFNGTQMEWGPMVVRDKRVFGPTGAWLDYSNLIYKGQGKAGKPDFAVLRRQGESRIYKSKFIQNIIEFLSRLILTEAMVEMHKTYKAISCTHDEGLFLVPEADAKQAKTYLHKLLTTPPAWASGIPLEAEVGYDVRYTK